MEALQSPAVGLSYDSSGNINLSSAIPLPADIKLLPQMFDEAARENPDRTFICHRFSSEPWVEISYSAAKRAADGLAQWLIDAGVGTNDRVSYLSAASIEHAISAVGVQRCGAALAPISPAYSLLSKDHKRLKQCLKDIEARFVIVDRAADYSDAMIALGDSGFTFICVDPTGAPFPVVSFAEVLATEPTTEVDARVEQITGETVARIMFTSGSSGSPKAVPQTHANLAITVAQCRALGLLELGDDAPQFLESMPFHHMMGGSYNFNNLISVAGTIYIDEGKPTSEMFGQTMKNLRDVSPSYFLSVPIAYEMLCNAMEGDSALRKNFFSKLRFLGFGGAVLSKQVAKRLQRLSVIEKGKHTPIIALYGATEYSSATAMYWGSKETSVIGLPTPGVELKLKPRGDRYGLWIKTPTMMPGYVSHPELNNKVFDEAGYFDTGDAVRFLNEDPSQGLVFAGRLSEDFKLSTGTFINVGELHESLMAACKPLVQELVVCGLNQNWVGVLLWPDRDNTGSASPAELKKMLSSRIESFNREQTGSSRRIGTALVVEEPLSLDKGELTAKGNVCNSVVRERKSKEVGQLFDPQHNPDVIDFRLSGD